MSFAINCFYITASNVAIFIADTIPSSIQAEVKIALSNNTVLLLLHYAAIYCSVFNVLCVYSAVRFTIVLLFVARWSWENDTGFWFILAV